ncbi:MAG: hypothetical protein AUREO_022870 [Aureobasidium pullulans]|nr:MAG: hypothetical protein AUREO_022870 [Aureobasidium pullulans]
MPSQISEQIHRPKNITRKDIACFANAQQKPKLYSTNHLIAKDQNQMEMENKRKRSSNGLCLMLAFGASRSNRYTSKQAQHCVGLPQGMPSLEETDLNPFILRRYNR